MHAVMNSVMLVPASRSDPGSLTSLSGLFAWKMGKKSPGDEVSRLVAQANFPNSGR